MPKAKIKTLGLDMTLRNTGIEIEVTDASGHQLGDLIVNKSGLEWCQGKRHRGNGAKLSWEKFAAMMNRTQVAT